MNVRSTSRQVLALSAGVTFLVRFPPSFGDVFAGLREPRHWLAHVGADQVVAQLAGALAWCAVAWLTLGVLVALLLWLPGRATTHLASVAEWLLPAALRRALGIGIGVTMVLGPACFAHAAPSGVTPTTGVRPGVADSIVQRGSLPAPSLPARAVPQLTTAPALPGGGLSAGFEPVHRVRPGESLWSIAREYRPNAAALQVARLWPRIYDQNRNEIGSDPNLLRPGQVLRMPQRDGDEATR
jgi:hypothetical protein